MEENNRKGPGIFYAVVGVATLVVAIIGATFAYFSASAQNSGQEITGGTNDDLASALAIKATRITFDNPGVTSDDLVPAQFGNAPASLTAKDIEGAINAKCVNKGYTGCHIWKIEAGTKQAVQNASIVLGLSVDATDKADWSYAVFTADSLATAGSATNVQVATVSDATSHAVGSAVGSIGNGVSNLDIHNNAAMNQTTFNGNEMSTPSNTYYLMVYLKNTDSSQNGVEETGKTKTDATGTYTGTLSMNAAGGQVFTEFSAAQ